MLLSSSRRETATSRCLTRRLRRCPRRSRCCCKAGQGRAGMVCEHHPSPRPRPKSQAAGRARARARTRAGPRPRRLAALSVRSSPPCARASPPAPWAGRPCHTPVASSWRRGSLRSTAAASSRRAAREHGVGIGLAGRVKISMSKAAIVLENNINRLTWRAAPAPEARGGGDLT
jgi:hypothetical protein